MNYFFKTTVIFLTLLTTGIAPLKAFDADTTQETLSYGKISELSEDRLKITLMNDQNENLGEKIFQLHLDVEWENIDSLKDLSVGDTVEFEYVVKKKKGLITFIELIDDETDPYDSSENNKSDPEESDLDDLSQEDQDEPDQE